MYFTLIFLCFSVGSHMPKIVFLIHALPCSPGHKNCAGRPNLRKLELEYLEN
jgi:hypothetical protein